MNGDTSRETEPDALSAIRGLIVDNDRAHAHTMSEILERIGYPCDVATSGPEGLKRVQENVYDVMVTDLVMNDVDGMELLARTKELLPECQVIMVTGHASVPKAVEAMQQGAFEFPGEADFVRTVCGRCSKGPRMRSACVARIWNSPSGWTNASGSKASSTPAAR